MTHADLMKRPELFLIDQKLIDSCSMEEIHATYRDMKELNIAHMPYTELDISIMAYVVEDGHNGKNKKYAITNDLDGYKTCCTCEVRFKYKDEYCKKINVRFNLDPDGAWFDIHNFTNNCAEHYAHSTQLAEMLIVLLATKSVVKTRTKDKLLAMGIGKRRLKDNSRPLYTTTLSLPKEIVPSASTGNGTGTAKRPHLRRGHIRRQHHGPKYQFVKKVWIEPCFVNADEAYTPMRFSYNMSGKGSQPCPSSAPMPAPNATTGLMSHLQQISGTSPSQNVPIAPPKPSSNSSHSGSAVPTPDVPMP